MPQVSLPIFLPCWMRIVTANGQLTENIAYYTASKSSDSPTFPSLSKLTRGTIVLFLDKNYWANGYSEDLPSMTGYS